MIFFISVDHFIQTLEKVGFVGLGNMGAHMARNLIKNGHPLVVYDVSTESVNSLKESGLFQCWLVGFHVFNFVPLNN